MSESNKRKDLPSNTVNVVDLPDDKEPTEDSSLQEENTLGVCLSKLLKKSDVEENDEAFNMDSNPVFGTTDEAESCNFENYPFCFGGRTPNINHCQSSVQASNSSSETEMDKLRKWREAGVALRKALGEQSSDSLARTPSSMSSSFHGGNDDPMNVMLDDYMSGPLGNVLENVCNTTSDIKEIQSKLHNKLDTDSTKLVPSQNKKVSKRDSDDISQGLAEVREKIKRITSRISVNNTTTQKSQNFKPSRCVARSRGLSSKTDSSSSESEDVMVPKRHKFVHKSNRTRSHSRSPKTTNTPPENLSVTGASSAPHSSIVNCVACGGLLGGASYERKYQKKVVNIPNVSDKRRINGEERPMPRTTCTKNNENEKVFVSKKDQLKNVLATDSDEELPNLETSSEDETSHRGLESAIYSMQENCKHLSVSEEEQEEEISKKLRHIASKARNHRSARQPHPSRKAHICSCSRGNMAEGDSSHLADVESSVHSGESALLESEDFLEEREIGKKTDVWKENLCDCNNLVHCHLCGELYSDTHWFEPSLEDIDIPAECAYDFQHIESTTPYASYADDEDTFECSHGDDLDDLADLDLGTRSNSECDDEKIELDQQEIDDLPGLVVTSSDDASGEEADDEFECDCPVCQRHRRLYDDHWITENEEEGNFDPSETIQYNGDGAREGRVGELTQPISINVEELTPLDLIFMQLREGGRQEFLELMFHNVIMQMLSVYPDLLGDQAPPPAPPTMVDNLPVKKINKNAEGDSTCPICLCNFQDGEEARELPCKHVFHLLCIQMWLNKSGTCPVCRYVFT